MNHRFFGALLALSLLTVPARTEADPPEKVRPQIEGLSVRAEGDRTWVSFRVTGAISAELEERIQSGLPVTFKHRLEVKVKRGFPVMFDKTVARTVVETRVTYDSLTQRYELQRTIEQRMRKKNQRPPTEEQRRVTGSAEEMRAWMETLEDVPVFDPARKLEDEKLWARVEVNLGRRYFMWVFPTSHFVSDEILLEP